jgi:hypothetical protein
MASLPRSSESLGACAGRGGEKPVYYVEGTCALSSMVAWLLFGALAVPTLTATATIGSTVLLACLCTGFTARPLAGRYGADPHWAAVPPVIRSRPYDGS